MRTKLIFAALLTAAVSFAQRGGGGGGMEGPSMNASGDRGAMSGHPTNRLDVVAEMLKLDKDQKKQFKTAMDQGQKEAAPVKEEITSARMALAESVGSGKSGDDLKPALEKVAAAEARMHQIELAAFAKLYQGLEKDQQAKIAPVYMMMSGIFKGRNWQEMN